MHQHGAGQQHDLIISVGIITVSDSSWRGEREDLGGPAIREMMLASGAAIGGYVVVPGPF